MANGPSSIATGSIGGNGSVRIERLSVGLTVFDPTAVYTSIAKFHLPMPQPDGNGCERIGLSRDKASSLVMRGRERAAIIIEKGLLVCRTMDCGVKPVRRRWA